MSQSEESQKASGLIAQVFLKIFKPLVRILLKNSVPYKTAADLLKWSYVEVAKEDFTLTGRKQSKSRLSVLTGLSRVEVDRVLRAPHPEDGVDLEQNNRAAQVVTGWLKDQEFQNGERPADLELGQSGRGFAELVRRYSGGTPERAMRDELIRQGAAAYVPSTGFLRLVKHCLIPEQSESQIRQLPILAQAVSDLVQSIDHNIYEKNDRGRFQRIVYSRRLPKESLSAIQEILFQKGQQFSDEIDSALFDHSHDHSIDPVEHDDCHRAGVGIYYFEDSPKKHSSKK